LYSAGSFFSFNKKKIVSLGLFASIATIIFTTYIVALLAFIAPSVDFPLEVTGVATFDTNNNPLTSFSKGTIVRVNATVEMATHYYINTDYTNFEGDTSYRIIIAVMNGEKSPLSDPKYATKTISPGTSQVTSFDYTIPSSAKTGTYTIKVVVWSDWLPSGAALAQLAGEQTFQVT